MKICKCKESKIKLASPKYGLPYYMVLKRNRILNRYGIQYSFHRSTDRITDTSKPEIIQLSCCGQVCIMDEHIE